jgi:trans-aconitate 2-methyltransferase
MAWSPTQYSKFEQERNRPIHDLIAQIPNEKVGRAVDVGCGPGNSTELLQQRYPEASVMGIDNSAEMIEAAKMRLPGQAFEIADVSAWSNPGPFDVILSNAVLQWVPSHETLIPALLSKLAPGGSLAVQIPDNLDEPAHVLMREIAVVGPWAGKLARAHEGTGNRHDVAWHYRLLRAEGVAVNIWRTTFHHTLQGGPSAIVEWFKSTGLRPFIEPLDPAERAKFLERYEAGLAEAYPTSSDGTVLLPFPRLFFVATR